MPQYYIVKNSLRSLLKFKLWHLEILTSPDYLQEYFSRILCSAGVKRAALWILYSTVMLCNLINPLKTQSVSQVNCCRPSPAQSILVPSLTGPMTTFYCLTSLGDFRLSLLKTESESESESDLHYDGWLTANQFVLVPSPLRTTTRYIFKLNPYGHSPYVTS
jgi:hypothetical protein